MHFDSFFNAAAPFLEEAGFDVILALDNWEVARQTHKLNHPKCKHPGLDCHFETGGDILHIQPERVNEIVPDVNVILAVPFGIEFEGVTFVLVCPTCEEKPIEETLQIVCSRRNMPFPLASPIPYLKFACFIIN